MTADPYSILKWAAHPVDRWLPDLVLEGRNPARISVLPGPAHLVGQKSWLDYGPQELGVD